MILYFSAYATNFATAANLKTILIYLSVLGVLSVGQTLVMIGGGFDLSNGANLAFASTIGATMLLHGDNQGIAAVVTVLVAIGLGLINGILVAVLNVNAFIATLSTYLIYNGAAYVYTDSNTVNFPVNLWTVYGGGTVGVIPVPVIILAVCALLAAFLLRRTSFGRSLFAIGGNPVAARLSGISIRKNLIVVFALSGLTAGIGALIQSSLLSAGSASFTGELNLQSITAVVLGGAALSGGEGSVLGTIIGVGITQTMLDGLTLMNISSFYQNILTGVILLFAVTMASARQHLARRPPGWLQGKTRPPPATQAAGQTSATGSKEG